MPDLDDYKSSDDERKRKCMTITFEGAVREANNEGEEAACTNRGC